MILYSYLLCLNYRQQCMTLKGKKNRDRHAHGFRKWAARDVIFYQDERCRGVKLKLRICTTSHLGLKKTKTETGVWSRFIVHLV